MPSKLGEAYVDVRAKFDKLDKDLGGLKSKVSTALTGVAVAGGAALAGLGIAVTKFSTDSIKEFASFEQGMNEVFTLLPGITQETMDKMSKDVLNFSKEFGTLPEEVIPALYQAISAGVPPENVFDFLGTAQKAAIGGVTDLETSVDGISSVVNAYGEDVITASEASDLMFTAVKQGKTNVDELSKSLFNVTPTAASLGVKFGNVTAALASMTAQGVPTSVATTQLRQLLVELSKEGSAASETFKEISGQSFADFISAGGNVQGALQLMEEHAAGANLNVSDLFGSVEAGNAALALTGGGTETFTKNLAEMEESGGAAATAFEQMDTGIGRAGERAQALWSTIKIGVGDALEPLISSLIEIGEDAMPFIQEAMDRAMPILEEFGEQFATKIGPALKTVGESLNRIGLALGITNEEFSGMDLLLGILQIGLDLIIQTITNTALIFDLLADSVEAAAEFVEAIKAKFVNLGEELAGLGDKLPDWLKPGSPTPLEVGIKGLSNAINQIPDFSSKFEFSSPSFAGVGAGDNVSNMATVNIGSVSATSNNSNPADEAIRMTMQLLRQQLKTE